MKVSITAKDLTFTVTSSSGACIVDYRTSVYSVGADVKALIEEIGLLSRMAMAMEEPAPKCRSRPLFNITLQRGPVRLIRGH